MIRRLAAAARKLIRLWYVLMDSVFRDRRLEGTLAARAEQVPVSNGTAWYTSYSFRVGIICDSFLYQDYRDTCALRYIRPDTPESELRELDLLLVTSVWHGLGDEWTSAGKEGTRANHRLHEVQRTCRQMGIPVAFYSKEDPPNWEYFLNLAADADFIFTSAAEYVDRYRSLFPGRPVDCLRFSVNPALFNPIGWGAARDDGAAVFAGSWIPKYPERIQAQDSLFRVILSAGLRLHILDRNSDRGVRRFRYPLRFRRYAAPCVDRERLGSYYKIHGWVINLNSVTDSGSMFAGRIYDALACGCAVLSNRSVGMERQFPEVYVPRDQRELREILRQSPEIRYVRAMESVLRVMDGNTSYDRMAQILHTCGLPCEIQDRRILVLLQGSDPEKVSALESMFREQTYPEKTLLPASAIGTAGSGRQDHDILTIWTEGRRYGPRYLEAMACGFKYTRCRYITKQVFLQRGVWTVGREHTYVEEIQDKYCTLFWKGSVTPEALLEMPSQTAMSGGYSSDRLHYESDGG